MQIEDNLTVVGSVVLVIASFAVLGGSIARYKRRSPEAGFLRGLFLGPIGILIELRAPYNHRPIVDEKSVSSLQSMLVYQVNTQKQRPPKEGG